MPDAWCWWWRAKWKPKWKFQNRCLHEGGVGIDAAPEHAGSSIAAAQKLLSNRVSSLPIIIVAINSQHANVEREACRLHAGCTVYASHSHWTPAGWRRADGAAPDCGTGAEIAGISQDKNSSRRVHPHPHHFGYFLSRSAQPNNLLGW
jgi:hypothetical protein